MLRYLLAKTFEQNELDIDFETLKYINSLNGRATSVDSIIEILKKDKIKNMQDKFAYEKIKKQEGKTYTTSLFDTREKRLDKLITMVILRRNNNNQYRQEQAQVNNFINENKTREKQEWEMIKEKYDYDELSPEKQEIIEQQFFEMIYKRKMKEHGIDDDLFDDIEKNQK